MKTKVLHISPDFNYSCGVSKHVFINLKYLSNNPDYELYFITNKGDSIGRLENISELNYFLMNFEKDHKNPIKLIKDFFQLLSYCKKYKINIIHTHHRYPELLSVLVSKITGAKTITTVHSFVKGLKNLSFRSDKIITVSKAVKEHLYQNYQHAKGRCETIYNCIDESFYDGSEVNPAELRKFLGYSMTDKILLFAGRISTIKGCDILIEAFKKLPQSSNAKLLMIGSISDLNINSLIGKNDDTIKILEPQNDMKLFYEIADMVVLPSREDPFPYVMLEAGAMQKPFIGGRTGGIDEFIEDVVEGYLIEPGNEVDLADKIEYVIKHPVEAENTALKLNEKVARLCNCKEYFQKILKIYKNLVET